MPKGKKKRNRQMTSIAVAPRNPYTNHPLMRKGGVHQKSKSAERSQTRREVKQMARDWSKLSSKNFYFSVQFSMTIFKLFSRTTVTRTIPVNRCTIVYFFYSIIF